MKKTISFLFLSLLFCFVSAQKKDPKWIANAEKALFTVEATTKNGVTNTGSGFFIHENGEAISVYGVFRNVETAVVVTANGTRLPVTRIWGADDMYDVIRFQVAVPKKTEFLPLIKTPVTTDTKAILLPSKEEKERKESAIVEITKMNGSYDYYRIEAPLHKSQEGFPLLNENGEVFALAQADASGQGNMYGISVAYIKDLHVASMDLFKRTYTDIGIRKAWNQQMDDALVSLLFLASKEDPPTYLETLTDFIATFPDSTEGYRNRATHYAYYRKELAQSESEQSRMLDLAMADLDKIEKMTKHKGNVYYQRANLIFGIASGDSTLQNVNWSIKKAQEYLQKAITEEDLPIYHQLKGDIAFYLNQFADAATVYAYVNQSPAASSASYYMEAKSKQQIEGSNFLEIISLIDTAIQKSVGNEASAYLLENAELKMQFGMYEQAIKDFDKYYLIALGKVNDAFFYYREQAKFRNNDLMGALSDIEQAILMNKDNAIYQAEKASIYLRLQDPVQAQTAAEKALQLDPDFASTYRLLGVCLLRQDKKTEACQQFTKAKELGDQIVERLINEHCK